MRISLIPASVFDLLRPHTAFSAAYDSGQRQSEHASTCLEGTRERIVNRISDWVKGDPDNPICWLEGPAGSGKSTVAHTIAKQCDDKKQLAFTFFFSRGKQDRSDTSKFFPTFAYQLATFVPEIQTSMRDALITDPAVPTRRLEHQIKKLIVDPILAITRPASSLIVIIDGLDECSGDAHLLQQFIRLLVDTTVTHHLPFRFLFVSRPEDHIHHIFALPSIQSTYHLSLRDFPARDDVRKYLASNLGQIRDVPRPWPTERDLEVLVDHSQGLFIWASTVVRFVGDGTDFPQQKLQDVMRAHTGIDALYCQVLSEARKFARFAQVIGAIMFLRQNRQSLSVSDLEQFLGLQSGGVRLALRGCRSILAIPNDDTKDRVRPYHASLQEFLVDDSRAKDHFLSPLLHHTSILVDCGKLIVADVENNMEGGQHLDYAWQNWCYHFSLVLFYGEDGGHLDSHVQHWTTFIGRMQQQWLKFFLYKQEGHLSIVSGDLDSVVRNMKVRLFMSYGTSRPLLMDD
jgi:hypothetical protein